MRTGCIIAVLSANMYVCVVGDYKLFFKLTHHCMCQAPGDPDPLWLLFSPSLSVVQGH